MKILFGVLIAIGGAITALYAALHDDDVNGVIFGTGVMICGAILACS